MSTVNIEIDGKALQAPIGSVVIQAADAAGIYIPRFCYHHKLSIAANCRMCLVEVEKIPKPVPACATQVAEGMKVSTRSATAVRAQKGVMEFLLINHPLDCPICDQGGECDLQDQAVGFGAARSRFQEMKRVVTNKELGPLIATDMTRCIHCTRCVRFGQEIGGIMELGMVGRGEHAEITAFVEHTVDSELSGNMIDLCPVGALTSKPFRYTARTWELARRPSISPHCGIGSNLEIHVKNDRVMRVLPRENEEINECWLSDKERFSYQALNSEQRLLRPLVRRGAQWHESDWQPALDQTAQSLKHIIDNHGADAIAALISPHSTLEECYLLQKMLRSLGSNHIEHRLRQRDFRLDGHAQGVPWLGCDIASIDTMRQILVVGSTLRKDHPLLAHRLRQAVKRGAQLHLVNPVDDDLFIPVSNSVIVAPHAMVDALARILKAAIERNGVAPASAHAFEQILLKTTPDATALAIATGLLAGAPAGAVFLGNMAQHHPGYAELVGLSQAIADVTGVVCGVLGEAANSVGAYLAGAVPHHGAALTATAGGLDARKMLETPRKAYLLFGVEAELDSYDPQLTLAALRQAELVVVLSAFKYETFDYAHLSLPVTPFSETSGTFINTEGRAQSFSAVATAQGEARPGWKVLRVLANALGLPGFDYESSQQVLDELRAGAAGPWWPRPKLNNRIDSLVPSTATVPALQRIGEVPIYQADALARRASSLQATSDAAPPVASMSSELMQQLGIGEGGTVKLRQGSGEIELSARRDPGVARNCVRVAAGHPATAALGGMFDAITVGRCT
ncbi:MAG: NADH-quinone oxidoreductase subunit NuoG [Burkholderiales bacterium]